jgi:cobalt-precorrin-5B (C1)-methyltransferase
LEDKAKRGLRKGFTTGTAAAAATKAATMAVLTKLRPKSVSVTLPRGGSLKIPIKKITIKGVSAEAVVVKDAGSDPDVTHRAEIVARVELNERVTRSGRTFTRIKGGKGVGRVTKPGLAIAPGRAAINPVPLKMIRTAVREVATEHGLKPSVTVTVIVPRGEKLALKTMNSRLGILGGISILGTTGIVHPMSLSAYCHSISASIDVALAANLSEVVFSTGRSSEKVMEGHIKNLPPEAFALIGDHMGFALTEAATRKRLKRVTVAGQFGKFTKLARGEMATHCADSSIEFAHLVELAKKRGAKKALLKRIEKANTAREVFFILKEAGLEKVFSDICLLVKRHAKGKVGKRIKCAAALVGYDGKLEAVSR